MSEFEGGGTDRSTQRSRDSAELRKLCAERDTLRTANQRLEVALRAARKHVAYAADHCEQARAELDLIDETLSATNSEVK